MNKERNESWEPVSEWYDEKVGEKGHYYHRQVILPNLLKLLDFNRTANPKILDVACGQGFLARVLSNDISYVGVDLSPSLVKKAQERETRKNFTYLVKDLTLPLQLPKKDFTHAICILALQNIKDPLKLFKNVSSHLTSNGKWIIVINHPCFRIPQHSSWGVDLQKKIQYRRIDLYLSPKKIPIRMHPGKQDSSLHTWSFHHSLSQYSHWLKEAGFVIETMEEWCSDKKSTGKHAQMEDRARNEFPLFFTFVCSKML